MTSIMNHWKRLYYTLNIMLLLYYIQGYLSLIWDSFNEEMFLMVSKYENLTAKVLLNSVY